MSHLVASRASAATTALGPAHREDAVPQDALDVVRQESDCTAMKPVGAGNSIRGADLRVRRGQPLG
jgi:hypothetical protein